MVGFLGDGINDGPALKEADVGVSVDTAVDIARETADIILLEKNLAVLNDGVLAGREVFGNIIKYIKMGASSNFGNMFSVIGPSIFTLTFAYFVRPGQPPGLAGAPFLLAATILVVAAALAFVATRGERDYHPPED